MPPRPYVAIDRDGTLIEEKHYLSDPDGVELVPGAGEALVKLAQRGFLLILVTNQSGIGRGYYAEEDMRRVHERIEFLLKAEGVTLDGIYFCPHTPDGNCACRKPQTGMLTKAADELGFNPASGYVIGDKEADVLLAHNVGAKGILVRTGHGKEASQLATDNADHLCANLPDAAKWILAQPLPEFP